MLKRDLYHGLDTYNESRKRNQWGKKQQQARPESEHLTRACEDLRIVDEALWNRVQARLKETEGRALRFGDGRLAGRPPKHAIVNVSAVVIFTKS